MFRSCDMDPVIELMKDEKRTKPAINTFESEDEGAFSESIPGLCAAMAP